MTEDDTLVWYEADGTRHVLGEAPPAAAPPQPDAGPRPAEAAEPFSRSRALQPVEAEPPPATGPAESTLSEAAVAAPAPVTAPDGSSERADGEAGEAATDEEPSALNGMLRALLLGAAAAAATGAVVGAISLAATGDRPDTVDQSVVPATLATDAEPSGTESPPTTVETVELAPPTTSAGQSG